VDKRAQQIVPSDAVYPLVLVALLCGWSALSGFNVRAGDGACLYLNFPVGFPLLLATAQRLFGSLSVAWYVPALSATVELVAVFGIGTAYA
jgi:hypothetical protein